MKDIVLDYIYEIMKSIIEFILGIITSAVHFVASVPDFFDAFYELVFHEPNQIVRIIKIVSFMLALVSWIATAQGLQQYIFTESEFQAYAVSFGIQGLLFVVNLNIVDYLIGKKEEKAKQQNANGTGEQETADLEGSEGSGVIQTRAAREAAATIPHSGGKTQENEGFRAIIKEAWSEFGANVAKTIRGILRFPWTVWGKKIVLLRMLLLLCLIGLSSGFSYIYIVTMVYEDTKYADIDAKLQKEYQDIYSQTAEYANRKKASLLMDIYGTLGALSDTGGNDKDKEAVIEDIDYKKLNDIVEDTKFKLSPDDEEKSLKDKWDGILDSTPKISDIINPLEKSINLIDEWIELLEPYTDNDREEDGKKYKGIPGVENLKATFKENKGILEDIQGKYRTNEILNTLICSELSKEHSKIDTVKKYIDILTKMVLENPKEPGKSDEQLRIAERLYVEIDAFDHIANTVLSSNEWRMNSLKKLSKTSVPSAPIKNDYFLEGVEEEKAQSNLDNAVAKWKTEWKTRLDGLKAIIQILYETQGTMDALAEEAETEPETTEPATTEPATTEPTTTEPATTEPSTTEPATTEPATVEPSTTEATITESPDRTSILAGIVQWLLPNKKTSEEPVVSDQEVLMNNIHTLQDMERNYLGHVNVLEQGILYLTDGEYKNLARVSLFFALAMDLFSMYAGYLTSLAWKEGEKKEKAIESGILKMKRK